MARRAGELELLAVRLDELAAETANVRGLKNVTAQVQSISRQVRRLVVRLRIFARTGPDILLDKRPPGV